LNNDNTDDHSQNVLLHKFLNNNIVIDIYNPLDHIHNIFPFYYNNNTNNVLILINFRNNNNSYRMKLFPSPNDQRLY